MNDLKSQKQEKQEKFPIKNKQKSFILKLNSIMAINVIFSKKKKTNKRRRVEKHFILWSLLSFRNLCIFVSESAHEAAWAAVG